MTKTIFFLLCFFPSPVRSAPSERFSATDNIYGQRLRNQQQRIGPRCPALREKFRVPNLRDARTDALPSPPLPPPTPTRSHAVPPTSPGDFPGEISQSRGSSIARSWKSSAIGSSEAQRQRRARSLQFPRDEESRGGREGRREGM